MPRPSELSATPGRPSHRRSFGPASRLGTYARALLGRRPGGQPHAASARPRLEELEGLVLPATWWVTSAVDSWDPGSLRNAMLYAMFDSDAQCAVKFNIPGSGVHTISIRSDLGALPDITRRDLVIDATSEPGYNGSPLIQLDGGSAGANVNGLTILLTGGCTIKGLAISRFSGWGISVIGSGNVIQFNRIGTDPSGTLAQGNGKGGVGLFSGFGYNTVLQNTISGNNGPGVMIMGATSYDESTIYYSDNNVLMRNMIGLDSSGTKALGNNGVGVFLDNYVRYTRIGTNGDGNLDFAEGNFISANASHGIHMQGAGTSHNIVAANMIGVDYWGSGALGNGGNGVWLAQGTHSNRIGITGDTYPGYEPNVISANSATGVLLTDPGTDGNVIAGNSIGTTQWGDTARGNGFHGVALIGGPRNNRIGTNGNGITDDYETNTISANGASGVVLIGNGTNGNIVAGNSIGTDRWGRKDLGNANHGVGVWGGAQNNRIGSYGASANPAGERNLISGNEWWGVGIADTNTNLNVVAGNWVGTDWNGTAAIPNVQGGVAIFNGAQSNLIGSNGDGVNDPLERNIIAGNTGHGVGIFRPGTSLNAVAGNYIGLDVTGAAKLSNSFNGVMIWDRAVGNRIGTAGTTANPAGERNVISGNSSLGVYIVNAGTNQNVVAGNYIGTDAGGTVALGNAAQGVGIDAGAQNNRIGTNGDGVGDVRERNVIAASGNNGVAIAGVGTNQNVVAGNYIGTDLTGTAALKNAFSGVAIWNGAKENRIGTAGTSANPAGERNVISGNTSFGVHIVDTGTSQNVVAGNLIGLDVSGTAILANGGDGVGLFSSGNRVGTNADGAGDGSERNVISGNSRFGIAISGTGATQNTVAGNFIGTDVSGTLALRNATGGVGMSNRAASNLVGSNGDGTRDAAERNVISGNTQSGVSISGTGTNQNVVAGNYIGTDLTGGAKLPNTFSGVAVSAGAQGNRIGTGGTAANPAGERNVISGNGERGVWIIGAGTNLNVVAGNFIGTDSTGTGALGNTTEGVLIASGAQSNRVGNNADGIGDASERNLVSGNAFYGVAVFGAGTNQNVVAGNYVGTDWTGTTKLPNGAGVGVWGGAQGNRVGVLGADPNAAAGTNLISGNNWVGIGFSDTGTKSNVVAGNRVGTNAAGTHVLGNGADGVYFGGGASENRIGTDGDGVADALERNLISGNKGTGILLQGTGNRLNVVAGNFIGTDATGEVPLGNQNGVRIESGASSNFIGDTSGKPQTANLIRGNVGYGVAIVGTTTAGNPIHGNAIFGNGGRGIDLGGNGATPNDAGDTDGGPNLLQNYPVLTQARAGATTKVLGTLASTPNRTFRVFFYATAGGGSSGSGEGDRALGSLSVTTDGQGAGAFVADSLAATSPGELITATAEDTAGNTSEFSAALATDNAGPTVTVAPAAGQADLTNGESITFDVVFSEPAFSFDPSDIDLSASTVGGSLSASVSGSGATYTVTVTGMSGVGAVVARVPDGAAEDIVGNPSLASPGPDASVAYDGVGATATIEQAAGQADPTNEPAISFDLVFSEPVTGLTGADIDLTGSTVGGLLTANVSGAGAAYTVTVTGMSGVGTVVARVPAGAAADLAGNSNLASTGADYVVSYDHVGTIGFSSAVYEAVEGAGTLTITVTRFGGTDGAVSVDFGTADGTAGDGRDFAAVTGTLSWADGETGDRTFSIPITDDPANEGRELFQLALTGLTGLDRPGRLTAQVVITPSDAGGPGTYFDHDGDKVTITLGGKVGAVAVYRTDPDGDGNGPIEWIDLTGTDPAKSTLSVTVVKSRTNPSADGRIALGAVTGTGLKSLAARSANLTGAGLDLTGYVGSLQLGDVTNGADIRTTGGPLTHKTAISLGAVGDDSSIRLDNPIGTLTARSFGAGSVNAPSAATITVAGDLAADLTLGGAGVAAGRPVLGSLRVTGAVRPSSDIRVAGPLTSATVGAFQGTLTAASIGTLAVMNDLTGDVTVTGAGVGAGMPAVGALTVAGNVDGGTIRVGGNVTLFRATRFRDSTFFAGYAGPVDGFGEFDLPAVVSNFQVTGAVDAFQDSHVIATAFNSVSLRSIDPTGDVPFGFLADERITRLKVIAPEAFTFTPLDGALKVLRDFEVRIV